MFSSRTLILAFCVPLFIPGCTSKKASKAEGAAHNMSAQNQSTTSSVLTTTANSFCECMVSTEGKSPNRCDDKMQSQYKELGITDYMSSRPYLLELGKCSKNPIYNQEVNALCSCIKGNFDDGMDTAKKVCLDHLKELTTKTRMMANDNLSGFSFLSCLAEDEAVYKAMLKLDRESKRAELSSNLMGIKTAQIQYESEFGSYVACAEYPPRSKGQLMKWEPEKSGGFQTLDWTPDGNVRGSYSVKVTPNDFVATGVIDVDGDGVYATYTATKSINPTQPTTGPEVY